jgi:quinol monooxygenase YgiN
VIDVIKETIQQVHAEDGCELYSLNEAPDRLVMVEKWASQQAMDAHAKGPTLAALGPKLVGKVTAAPEVVVLQPVPAGEPAKGAV